MKVRALSYIMIMLFMTSCKENVKKKYENSIIDREKIDKAFGQALSQVRFDHLYVVLDSVSYAQFTQNAALKSFYASIDKGLPDFKAIDSTTTSCYLRGHEHFIELLGPDNEYNEPIGKSGIGFSLLNKGEHFHLGVTPKLEQPKTPYLSISDTVDMLLGKNSTTWFKAFHSPGKETFVQTWYAFYNPAFLDSLHRTEHSEYSREAFSRNSYDGQLLFKGIKSITLTCTPQDYERIAQEMRQLGCKLMAREGNNLTIASGDISINITPSNIVEFSQIDHIECSLNAEDTDSLKLGNITITNSGTESIWNLDNLYKNN